MSKIYETTIFVHWITGRVGTNKKTDGRFKKNHIIIILKLMVSQQSS